VDRRRLFVAVWPPAEVADRLGDLERPRRAGLLWTTSDQWHVTLRFLGSLATDQEQAVRSALDAVDWTAFGPTRATAGPQPVAIGRNTWALPVHGVDALAGVAGAAVTEAGVDLPEADRGRPFRGHLTLARAKTPPAMKHLPAPQFNASWVVQDVTLVWSTLDPTAARYEVVERWRLDAARD